MEKKEEDLIVAIIENLPLYRGCFIRKSQLIKALEEAFPEKEEK